MSKVHSYIIAALGYSESGGEYNTAEDAAAALSQRLRELRRKGISMERLHANLYQRTPVHGTEELDLDTGDIIKLAPSRRIPQSMPRPHRQAPAASGNLF